MVQKVNDREIYWEGRGWTSEMESEAERPQSGGEWWKWVAEEPAGLLGLGWQEAWGLGSLPLIVRLLPKLLVTHIHQQA